MTVAAPPAPPARETVALADSLRTALLLLSRRLRNESQKAGLSAQDAVLLGLVKAKPGVGVSGLADAEHTSRPTMSGHVKRLETEGLLVRDADAEDGRRSGLTLTAAGVRKLEQIRAQRNDWLAKRLARLEPLEREQLAVASAALLKLASVE
ncbi:MarR family transcriptional regulator [Phenylobacterium sp. LjRoot225]|uniref:MarR family winged helix-turn-helix transcriptional regulator n=1 Tax=Phenylobacterium sp. LjRoot225 TaxID=3342285 RepID=UPI003ECD0CD1